MKDAPQTETTGDIDKNRMEALAMRARREPGRSVRPRMPGSGRDARIRERAWELFRDRAKDVDKSDEGVGHAGRLQVLGQQCAEEARIFEDAAADALGIEPEPELMQEPGQPFGPALRASERGQGVVSQDVPRLDPDEIEGLTDAAETFLEGGNRSD